jgi:hypothetical protein
MWTKASIQNGAGFWFAYDLPAIAVLIRGIRYLKPRNQNKALDGMTERQDLICYCFNYSRQEIEKDLLANGRSLILEKIAEEKRLGGCRCAVKNPKGR